MTPLPTEGLLGLEGLACRVAEQAGALALSMAMAARAGIRSKKDGSLVTIADAAVETLIKEKLRETYPHASFMGEETGGVPEGLCWIVDPIDGTSNFSAGLPFWCVSIALMQDGSPLVGVVHDPNLRETFSAVHGLGARLNGLKIRPPAVVNGNGFAACLGFPRSGEDGQSARMLEHVRANGGAVRSHGATALSMAYVAAGRLGLIAEPTTQLWDVAAAQLLVTEAGGGVFSSWRRDVPSDPFAICAYRAGLHDIAHDLFGMTDNPRRQPASTGSARP